MVHAEKAEQIKALKGKMTETEAAAELNVSVSTVRKLWGTPAPAPALEVLEVSDDDLGDTAFIIAEYRRVIKSMRAEYARYDQKERECPDNCAWGNLKIKAAQTEIKALNEMKEAIGLGKILYAGDGGYGYTDKMIAQYVGAPKPPVVKEMEDEEREYRRTNGYFDDDLNLF